MWQQTQAPQSEGPRTSAQAAPTPGKVTRASQRAPGSSAEDTPAATAEERTARLLELLETQAQRLERALEVREYLVARGAAETVHALEPCVEPALARAAQQDAGAGQRLRARAAALSTRLAPLLAQAPPSEPGLGIDLTDPSAEAAKQEAWRRRLLPSTSATVSSSISSSQATSVSGSVSASASAAASGSVAASASVSGSAAASASAPAAGSVPVAASAAASASAPASVAASAAASAAAPASAHQRAEHEAFEATLDRRISASVAAGQPLAALAYLHYHLRELRPVLGAYLSRHLRGTGDPGVAFVDENGGAFVAALLRQLDPEDGSRSLELLRSWLLPDELATLIDRNRALTHEPLQQVAAGARYAQGPRGPASWEDSVATALGAALLARLDESLPRMSQRLRAASANARPSEGTLGISARKLIPSTPLDAAVARALCGEPKSRAASRATVTVTSPLSPSQARATHVRHRRVSRLEWQGGKGGPWNGVVALEPADAGPEEVAYALWGSWAEAARLTRLGGMYLVREEDARRIPEAAAHRANAREAARTQVAFGAGAVAATEAEAARGAGADARPASAAELIASWQRIEERLRGLLRVLAPLGLAAELAAAMAVHAQRRVDLTTLAAPAAARRAAAFAQHEELLGELSAELATAMQGPSSSAVRELAHAIAVAHLPETGRRLLAEARARRSTSVLDGLERLLGQASSQLALAQQARGHTAAAAARSEAAHGAPLATRLAELRRELAAVRGRAIADHQLEPEAVRQLVTRAEKLRLEATLLAQLGALGQVFELYETLEGSGWFLLSEAVSRRYPDERPASLREQSGGRIGRLEVIRAGASVLRGELASAHARWLRTQKQTREGALDAAALEAELDALRAALAALGADKRVRELLEYAAHTAESAQDRALVVQLVTLLGAVVASGGAAALAEGAAVGAGASALTAQLAGLATESVVFGGLVARLEGSPVARELLHGFAGNVATFGALRATKAVTSGALRGLDSAARGVRWAAKAGELTAGVVVAAGVSFAQAQVQSLAARGRTLSDQEQHDFAVQGMAMLIGGALVHHGMTRSLGLARAAGAAATASRARSRELTQLAQRVASTGDAGEALALLRQAREHLTTELAELSALAQLSPRELAARGTQEASVHGLAGKAQAHLARLDQLEAGAVVAQLGLDVVVPGRVFAGPPARLAPVLESYRARGFTVEPTADGYRVTGAGEPELQLLQRETVAGPAAPAPEAPTKAPRSAAPRAELVPEATTVAKPTHPEGEAPKAAHPEAAAKPAHPEAAAKPAHPEADKLESSEGTTAKAAHSESEAAPLGRPRADLSSDERPTAPMAAIDPVALELARIRTGSPGKVRNVLELNNADVALAMNEQLRAIGPEQVSELLESFPASDRELARLVLGRSSGFANMEAWSAIVGALQPHLAAGKRLYTPGAGSLADNLAYTASKGQYAELPTKVPRIASTNTLEPGALVVLDPVILHKLQHDAAFARKLVDLRCQVLEPRGMFGGLNLFDSPTPQAIAQRTRALVAETRAVASAQGLTALEAIDAVLARPGQNALAAHAPELIAQVQVVDASAHPAVTDKALARQLSGDAGITPDELEGVLEPFSEQHRELARELLAQQAEVYSPRRFAAELVDTHAHLLARVQQTGGDPGRVYFYIPRLAKSYGMLAMAHREATGTSVDRYINGPDDLRARALATEDTLIVLDDVAGSGQSLEDSAIDIHRTGFTGKVLISPMVSTEKARTLFQRLTQSQPNVDYQPHAMSRALEESFFFKNLEPNNKDALTELIQDPGYASNALSMVFPYMAPDNNGSFFGSLIAHFYITNRNQHASKADAYDFSKISKNKTP